MDNDMDAVGEQVRSETLRTQITNSFRKIQDLMVEGYENRLIEHNYALEIYEMAKQSIDKIEMAF